MYKIADYHGEELLGTFYEEELQSIIKKDTDFYRIEKVTKSRIRGERKVKINVSKGGYVLITGVIATGFEQDTVIEKENLSPYLADVNGGCSSMYCTYTPIS